ncbi:hypothetical protein [Borrelia persica]|nr:hypothetical protein [Borrelia persica]
MRGIRGIRDKEEIRGGSGKMRGIRRIIGISVRGGYMLVMGCM